VPSACTGQAEGALQVNHRIVTNTTVSDAVKALLRAQIRGGWTSERISYEMQKLGHKGWSAHTPPSLTKEGTRPLTVDEAIGLVAVFRNRNRLIGKELDRLAAMLVTAEEGKG
jgi:hypothetical protein